ncbi:alanine racemase [Aquisalinus flavus]|uniref:Alanine racemase n=1 Tax=Aquisalinus flavus TaxID=1526572 RepID=A0A8J2Y7E9_9PROT|nr:alanine racemase [Aquisalinus flavus]MBD0427428.1 alanine racemase [Aquisalinus flavus]UNE47231.1 alanine racemase [Aquisalinus flavus]GGD00938.1 alanine racemase, catabolic [Aquisalinus flavus]
MSDITTHRPRLTIDLAAVAENYRTLAAMRPKADMAAVVKADCYGLGVDRIAPALFAAGCRAFFVAYFFEGVHLREILSRVDPEGTATICIFNGPARDDVDDFTTHGLTPVLNTLEQMRLWRQTGNGPAIIHIDTGMNRLGLTGREIDEIISGEAYRSLEISYLMSHFAFGANAADPHNAGQAEAFSRTATSLRKIWPSAKLSLSASAGLFLPLEIEEALIRPGVALYGAGPQDHPEQALKTVASLHAPILQIRDIAPGETCGYSGTFTAQRPTRLATIGIGYADGYCRALSNKGVVRINGDDCPVVGNVSMDLIIADISDIEGDARVGDMAECFGDNIRVEDHAARAGTIAYEVFTMLGGRIQKIYRT